MVDLNGQLRLHEEFRHSVVRVGREQAPVLVIDNFLSRAELLIDYAAGDAVFDGVSDTFYPGVRARMPPIYAFAVRAFLGPIVDQTFGLAAHEVVGELAYFSMVTRTPQQLAVPQRLPHIDSTNPRQLAVLHYLCGPAHGGTSFYRHRTTGLESIDEANLAAYEKTLTQDLRVHGPPGARYILGDDSIFERTHSCAAAFNRVLVYRSMGLHSADIDAGFSFDANPRTGRLTANTFFIYQ